MKGLEQGEAPQAAQEHDTPRSCRGNGSLNHPHQVFDAREVLRHLVQHDDIEGAGGDAGEIVGGARQQIDRRDIAALRELVSQEAQRLLRDVGARAGGAKRGDPLQQKAGAATDLQEAGGAQGEDARDRVLEALEDLVLGERLARVAAHPDPQVDPRIVLRSRAAAVDLVEHRPPQPDTLTVDVLVLYRDGVGHEALLSERVLSHDHGRRANSRMVREDRLDLPQLDAVAAHLDLMVDAPQVLDLAGRPVARQVARAIQALSRLPGQWIRPPGLRGLDAVCEVATPHADPAHEQLSDDADRQRLQRGIQDVEPQPWNRPADGDPRLLQRHVVRNPMMGHVVRAFGRPVGVEQGHGRIEPQPVAAEIRRECLAGRDHPAQPLQRRAFLRFLPVDLCDHDAQERGDDLEHGDPLPVDLLEELPAVMGHIVREDMDLTSDEQRGEKLPDRDIETLRGGLGDPIRGTQPQVCDLGPQVVHHAALLQHGPLWHAGRPRGVDHIGEVGGLGAPRRSRSGTALVFAEALQDQTFRLLGLPLERPRQGGGESLRHENPPGTARGDDLNAPRQRVERVERQVGGTGTEQCEHAHQEIEPALREERDHLIRSDPQARQSPRHAVDPPVEPAVGQPRLSQDGGHGLRSTPHLLGEERIETGRRPGPCDARIVPFGDHLMALGGREHRQLRHGEIRRGHGRREQSLVMDGQTLDRRGVEQVRGVFDRAEEPAAALFEDQGEIELRGGLDPVHRMEMQVLDVQAPDGSVLQGEHHLEKRCVREAAFRSELLHHLLERQVLVHVGRQSRRARVSEKRTKRRVAGEVAAQHQGVDEEPDQPLDLHPVAVGHGRADREALLTAVARQEHLEPGEKHHEKRRPLAPGQRQDLPRELIGQPHRSGETPRALHRRPQPVGRQLQERRQPGELGSPKGELLLQDLALEPGRLPLRKIRVLRRQRGQRRRPALQEGRVERRDLPYQDAHRPPVADDVMQVQDHDMVLLSEAQDHATQQGTLDEVERPGGVLICQEQGLQGPEIEPLRRAGRI